MKPNFKIRLLQSIQENYDRIAFVIDRREYSYAHFLQRISAVQTALLREHPTTTCVGIAISNSIDVYAAIVGSWLLGVTTVPLNPTFPKARIIDVISQSKIDLILTHQDIEINEDIPHITLCNLNDHSLNCVVRSKNDNDLLYVLFTSGSTGRPKGVPITNSNFQSFLNAYEHHGLSLTKNDRALQMFDLTFDVSIAAFICPLLAGATVFTVSEGGLKNQNIAKLLLNEKLTFATLVPSVLNSLKQYFSEIRLPDLRMCILTAEASHCDVIASWRYCVPNSKIVNLYGPTEATIWCAIYDATEGPIKGYNNMLAIGKPFCGTTLRVVGADLRDAREQEKGELLIASKQLTDRYLTDQPKNPFIELNGVPYYRTGDLCYMDEDEEIHYCGRIDHQVQIQGYRVELSEIEIAFEKAFNEKAVAVAFTVGADRKTAIGLCATLLQLTTEEVRSSLRDLLPSYMLPSVYVFVDKLPLTPSSKIDRVALAGRCGAVFDNAS